MPEGLWELAHGYGRTAVCAPTVVEAENLICQNKVLECIGFSVYKDVIVNPFEIYEDLRLF